MESFFDAPWRRTAALNRFIVAIAHSNLHFGFELARAKTVSDVLNLQAEYWQRLFNAFYGGEFPNWLVKAGAPGSPINQDESATGEHSHSQKKRKTAIRPVTGTAANKPEQGSNGPSRRAAKRASAVERKAEKIPSKPKEYRPPSHKADAGARKRPARPNSISRGRRVEIRFGRLDDSAVRFTSREAWRLRNGSWRRISVDKVLSDAIVLSKTRFDQLFPKLPQLPAGAFLPDQ